MMRAITPSTLKMLHVRANRMCTRIAFFVSKTVREMRAFFLSMTKIHLKRIMINHKLSRRTIESLTRHRQGVSARPTVALRKVWFSTA